MRELRGAGGEAGRVLAGSGLAAAPGRVLLRLLASPGRTLPFAPALPTHLRHVHARHLGQGQQQLAAGRRRAPRARQLALELQQALGEASQQVFPVAW